MNEYEPQDRIGLAGMVFYGHHGATVEEQAVGQRFVVDLEMAMDLSVAGHSDDLNDTADYGRAFEIVQGVLEGPPHALLESLAEESAQRLLDELPIAAARIRVSKPSAPIRGTLDAAWVEITRRR